MNSNNAQQFLDAFDKSDKASLPDWLMKKQRAALASVKASGLPTLRNEEWRYTDIRPILRRQYEYVRTDRDSIDQDTFNQYRFDDLDCYELVFVNGCFSSDLSNITDLPEGVLIKSLDAALDENPNLLQKTLSTFDNDGCSFAALNTVFIRQGTLIHIPRNQVLDKPIHIFYLNGNLQTPVAMHPRNLIIAGENSKASIIESYIGIDESGYFNNIVTEVAMEAGANIVHYKIQQESIASHHIGTLFINQARDSHFTSHNIALGSALARTDIHAQLNAPGAEINLNGLYVVNGKQHIDNHTRVDHRSPNTCSDENYRGILNDHGRGVFNGKVVVHKDAQKIEAHQSNANLLLSDNAEIDTKPELEIYADDVKCSHGTTVGQLDQDMLFYLRSRAIDEDTAKSLLTFAFAEEVINRLELAPVKQKLEQLVTGRLPEAALIREFTQ